MREAAGRTERGAAALGPAPSATAGWLLTPNPVCQPLPSGFGFSWPGLTLQAGWTVGERGCCPSGPSPHVLQTYIQVLTHLVCLQTKGAVVNHLHPRPGSSGARGTHAARKGGLGGIGFGFLLPTKALPQPSNLPLALANHRKKPGRGSQRPVQKPNRLGLEL